MTATGTTIPTSDGASIHYVERGAGTPIVLIGGWCMSTRFWHRQLEGLGEDHRVIAIDPRAYGESEKVAHGHRMARHAADLRDLLHALELDGAVAIGWSLGANVLLSHWELFGGERLAGLVHCEQSPYCLNRAGWEWGFGTEEDALAMFRGFRADAAATAAGLVDLCFHQPPSPEDKRWMVEEILKTPLDAALALEYDHIWSDWRDVVPTVRLPVLVTTGRQSSVFPWRSGEWMAQRLPDATHAIFERSGHCPFLEEPDRFNRVVREFVASLRAR